MNRQVRIHAAAKHGGGRMNRQVRIHAAAKHAAAPSVMILTRSTEAA